MRKRLKIVRAGVFGLGLTVAILLTVVGGVTKFPGEKMTPVGIRRSTSTYLKMRDGVEIAVTALSCLQI
ncbi:MAG TPA: hypothetical protein VEG68_10475 [Terriglobales bacterium]|nr:hypothetical protein [Terriglobales bacterium]